MKFVLGDDKMLAGLLMILGSAQFLTLMMVGEAIAPDYSMHENAISDLGTIDETRLTFNASLFAIGLLNLLAGYFFFKAHGNRILLVTFVVAGVGAMGAGLVPLDSPIGMHGLFALLAFLFMNLEALLSAKLFNRTVMFMSILAGIMGLLFLMIMILVDSGSLDMSGSIGHGGTERMIAYPVLLWMLMVGGYLLSGASIPIKSSGKG